MRAKKLLAKAVNALVRGENCLADGAGVHEELELYSQRITCELCQNCGLFQDDEDSFTGGVQRVEACANGDK